MNNKEDLLNEYFDAATSPDRRNEIKKQLSDEELALVALGEDVKIEGEVALFQQRLKNIATSNRRVVLLKFAATFLLLATTTVVLMNPFDKGFDSQELFGSYFQPYDGYVNTRGSGVSFTKGLYAYESGRYQEALNLFLESETDSAKIDQRNLLISSCHLQLGNPNASLQYLQQINDTKSVMIISFRDWYKSLSYLHMNQIDESKALLKKLAKSSTPLATKAKSLLNEPIFGD